MAKKAKPKRPAVNVQLSEELHYRATVYAAQMRRSLRDVLDEAVAEYLKNKKT